MEVEVGQVWRDNDRRTKGRLRVVIAIVGGKAQVKDVKDNGRATWVSLERFYRKRANGFELSNAPHRPSPTTVMEIQHVQ